MKLNLTKGPTVSPALIPIPNPVTGQMDVIGFSGMSEVDYVATHILIALLVSPDYKEWNEDECIDKSIELARKLLAKVTPQQKDIINDS